jgi:hypothetical protein
MSEGIGHSAEFEIDFIAKVSNFEQTRRRHESSIAGYHLKMNILGAQLATGELKMGVNYNLSWRL